MSLETPILLFGGFVALVAGAEGLVRGASRLAMRIGISPLVVGLTVVAFGTSAPELAVSTGAALHGQGDIALGNVIGSNIFNVLFILGLSALITPLVVQQQLVRLDVPLMIVASVLVWLMSLDNTLGRVDGIFLFGGVVAYTVFLIRKSRSETNAAVQAQYADELPAAVSERPLQAWLLNLLLIGGGFVLLVLGAGWLVDGAVMLARAFGVSELIIGLTVIAVGTSLPEVATSVLAALRGERDIAVGNIVGSNLFNIMAVLGATAVVAPSGIPVNDAVQQFDFPVMIAVAVACLPIFFTGYLITRWNGALLFAYYIFYTIWLVFSATGHGLTETYGDAMLYFLLPLTFATLLLFGLREREKRN